MNKSLIIALIATIGLGRSVLGQEVKRVSLAEAIEMSLTNSKQLKLSNAKVAEAVAATREAKDRKLPDVGVTGSYLRLAKPNIKIKTASSGGDSSAISPVNVTQAAYGMANVSLN